MQAYIAAMPGWKRAVGARLDEIIVRAVPNVRKAVKWNSPFYGAEDRDTWFLSYHCFTRYLKLTFFDCVSLDPVPPVASKVPNVRYVHIHEGDDIDAGHLASWIFQASALPGEKL